MLSLIPLICFFIFWFCFYQRDNHFRLSFLYAVALWGMIIWFSTEMLSIFNLIAFKPILLIWLIVLFAGVFWIFSYKDLSIGHSFRKYFKDIALTEKIILFFIVIIAVLKGISAFSSAPNTADALSYHLSRVEHWIQNHSIAYYPTHVTRQLYCPPWAEYVILHFRILSHGDYYSNTIQWFSAIGSWILISGLAGLIGAKRKGQLLAVFLAATLPEGLVQATSTQTDYVLTFWVVSFVYILWMMYQNPGWRIGFVAGIYLGLGFLTKGNAYLFMPIWLFLYLICVFRSGQFSKLKFLPLVLILAILINLPYGLRNTATFGKPFWTNVNLVNQNISPVFVLSNMGSNLGLHIHFPNLIHGHLAWPAQSRGEDDTSNELYLILFICVLLGLIFSARRSHKLHLIYAAGIVLMFIAFSAIIHFDLFNSRFHLAIFVMSTALVGALVEEWLPYRSIGFLCVFIFVLSMPWLIASNEHPLIGNKSIFLTKRQVQYFSSRPHMVYPYTQAVDLISSGPCHDIGLVSDENEWGYPWWVLFKQKLGDKFRLEDVDVKNNSSRLAYPLGFFDPCVLIASNDVRTMITLSAGVYVRAWYMQLPEELTSVFIKVR